MVKGSSSICAELVERHSIAEAFYDAVGGQNHRIKRHKALRNSQLY